MRLDSIEWLCLLTPPNSLVFHGALIVFAGIQIHETRTALVTDAQCSDNVCYITSFDAACFTERTIELWYSTLEQNQTIPDCYSMHYWRVLVLPALLDQAIVRRIWVGWSFSFTGFYPMLNGNCSWAIFHVVGANPKMKSELLGLTDQWLLKIYAQQCTNTIRL